MKVVMTQCPREAHGSLSLGCNCCNDIERKENWYNSNLCW